MTRLVLGNRNAVESTDHGESFKALPKGKRATEVVIPDELSLGDAFTAITANGGVWSTQATAGSTPAWVASDDENLAALVASHFGDIPIRELEDPS